MNKLQKRLVVFLLIVSLGLLISMFKVLKVVIEKNKEIEEFSLKNADLTKAGQDLKENLEKTEKKLAQTKLELEDVSYNLEEEKKKSESFQTQYENEKERGNELDANLNKLKLSLEAERETREKLAVEAEKLKEEKDLLSRDLNELRRAKEDTIAEKVGDAFIAESEKDVHEEKATGKIIKGYPQGFLAIELEKGSYDKITPRSLVVGQRNLKLLGALQYMIILEAAEGEDLSSLKKGEPIEYKYYIKDVTEGVTTN